MLYVSRPVRVIKRGCAVMLLLRPIVARCKAGFASGQPDSLERNPEVLRV